MSDQSHLDQKYFLDEYVYNCPFCNRRNVSYAIYDHTTFDWVAAKKCYVYFVRCGSCRGKSMHLTFSQLATVSIDTVRPTTSMRFLFKEGVNAGEVLDEAFFFSVPTSFFMLDERIPKCLRELLREAEGSLKSNFLTGASACARKLVYELASLERAAGENYDDRIKSLKKVHQEIDPVYFDSLLTIQQVTSSKVHENAFDGWESKHLRIILASLKEILHELYVVPALREDRRKSIIDLKQVLLGKSGSEPDSTVDQSAD